MEEVSLAQLDVMSAASKRPRLLNCTEARLDYTEAPQARAGSPLTPHRRASMAAVTAQQFTCVLFDLDDTLFDSTGTLQASALEKVVDSLSAAPSCPFDTQAAREAINAFERSFGSRRNILEFLEELVSLGKLSQDGARAAVDAYHAGGGIDQIELFADAAPMLRTLREQGFLLGVITSGQRERQQTKIAQLGLAPLVDAVVVDVDGDVTASITHCLTLLQSSAGADRPQCTPRSSFVVGDRVFREIKAANRLGCATARLRHGKYGDILPAGAAERPDYDIEHLAQVPGLLSLGTPAAKREQPRVVALGGGTGLSALLSGLRQFPYELTAVVTVFDSGRHTGKLRQQTALPAMGDLRKCIASLSEGGELMQRLVEFRFRGEQYGEMDGACLGNLILAALTKLKGGDFGQGVAEASQILKLAGRVLPVTLESTDICAELENGVRVCKEDQVRRVGSAARPKAPIRRVFLGHEEGGAVVENERVEAHAAALLAIRHADVIILSPGSFYTSIVATILVPGVAEAIAASRGKVVYVANLTTQPGQTDGLNWEAHLERLTHYLARGKERATDDIWAPFDFVIASNTVATRPVSPPQRGGGGAAAASLPSSFVGQMIAPGPESLSNPKLILEDVMQRSLTQEWNKDVMLRHDPEKLAKIVHGIITAEAEADGTI